MPASPSLAGRAVLALVLMIGFYALALGIAAGLLYIPYAEWTYGHRIHIKLALGCVVGAGLILISIVPRPDRFEPPGPLLDARRQPRLFAALGEVARATGQTMPREVYLVGDVNAWVSSRGGVMGLGSRRIMGVGLPLMQALTTTQMRAVLAHEFGHYHGGDTKLGPWIYKTRGAIGRTVTALAGAESVLQKPFMWYGNLFLRITHAISRAQEYTADALAARIVGARALGDGLRVVHGAAPAFGAYWSSEVAPVLGTGHRPPVAAGFARFLVAASIAETMARMVEREIAEAESDPFDTHPPLRDRLAALAGLPQGDAHDDGVRAATLLDDLDALERALVASVAGEDAAARLTRVDWERVGDDVYLPIWRTQAAEAATHLKGVTPTALPVSATDLEALGRRILGARADGAEADAIAALAGARLGGAIAVALAARGFRVDAPPGEVVAMVRADLRIEPFAVVPRLAAGELDAETWRDRCTVAGIADVDLAEPLPG